MRSFCLDVTTHVRNDDKLFYQELAQSQGDVAADEGINGLWRRIKHILPKNAAKTRSNIRCQGPSGDALTQHYCALEAGQSIAYDDLLSCCAQRQLDNLAEQPLQIAITEPPTRVEIETLCLQAQRGRAPGLDAVPAEVLQSLIAFSSHAIFDLMFKAWVTAAEPLQCKGGAIHSIAKKAGGLTAANMRGIMLLDNIGKIYHALVRSRLLPWANGNRLPTQFGGFKGQQPAFASLMLRSFVNFAASKRVSTAVVFVDVKSAFHCLLRQHAFGTGDCFPAALADTLRREGLCVDTLLAEARRHSSHFVDQVSPSLARVAQDAHCSTWFVCPQLPDCFETTRGSRPGSPLADLAYNVLMTSLLNELQCEVHAIGSIMTAHAFLEFVMPVLAWVDDIAMPVSCIEADSLDATLAQVMLIMHQVFNRFGLRLNLSKGKTEAVVHYRGPNAAQLRRARFLEHFSHLEVPGKEPLRIVTQYVHLGISFARDCDIKTDVTTKIGKATAAYRSLHRPLFGNKRIPIAIRLKLLESLVLPILFYGAGSWPLLPMQLCTHLSAVITRWQRQIIGNGYWKEGSLSDQALRALWKIPELALRLAKHRLLFLLQLRHHGPAILWDCLTAEDGSTSCSWLTAVRQALQWFFSMQNDECIPDLTCESIVRWAFEAPATMPKSIRRAVHRHLMQEFTAHQVVQAHRDLKSMCLSYGVVFENVTVSQASPLISFDCSECCKSFSTVQGLNAHRWKQHQTISIERQFVFSSTCLCCHRCFWTAQRLQQHLRYSRRFENGCLEWIQMHFEPQSTSTPIHLPEFFKGQFRLPWTHACGPEPAPPRALWAIQHDKAWVEWTAGWQKAGFPEDLSVEICESVPFRLGLPMVRKQTHWPFDGVSLLTVLMNLTILFVVCMPSGPSASGDVRACTTKSARSKTQTSRCQWNSSIYPCLMTFRFRRFWTAWRSCTVPHRFLLRRTSL